MTSTIENELDQMLYQWKVASGFIAPEGGATIHPLRGRQALLVGQMKDAAAWERYISDSEDPALKERLASVAAFKRMAAIELCKIHKLD